MSGYDTISELYDRVNSHVDYEGYAHRVCGFLRDCGVADGALVAELGCGTGRMTRLLAEAGYDMIGIDNSEGMLAVAKDHPDSSNILYLLQDMREFELYGTVGAAVCFLDGMNHLTGAGELEQCFRLIHNYLDPGGVFFFDLNTPEKFACEYGERDIIIEDGDDVLLWRNYYNPRTKICDFYISAFAAGDDGRYGRSDTWWRERCYSMSHVRRTLEKCGFVNVRFFGDDLAGAPDADCRRWYVSAEADKSAV